MNNKDDDFYDDESKPIYSPSFWSILYEKTYHDQIIDFAEIFPSKLRLQINYTDLKNCWGRLGRTFSSATEFFVSNPDKALDDAITALREYSLPNDAPEFEKSAEVAIVGFEPQINLRDIRKGDMGHYVAVTGTIIRKTDVKYAVTKAAFECQRCGHMNYVLEPNGVWVKPFECDNDVCGRKGPFKFNWNESTKKNKRKIRLQELADQITDGDQSLASIDCLLYEDVDCPPMGSVVTVSGILTPAQIYKRGEPTEEFRTYIRVNHIEEHDANRTIVITPEDIKEMGELAKDPNITDRLVASTAPTIKGYNIVKEGCLCSAVSPDNFMLPDGRELRGYSHVMLCGDPSTSKSMIMKAGQKLIARAQYAAGKAASSKGLTVAVVKDAWGDGAYIAEAGMLVLADRALAFIDELDKFEKEEQQELNSALSSSHIPVHKGGLHQDFYARCPVIAGLNPKLGRFDRFEPIAKQVNVPPDTLSRFDLIFLMLDVPGKADPVIEKHIENLWVKVSQKYAQYKGDAKEALRHWGKDEYAPDISLDMMRKWLHFSKTLLVEITPECAEVVTEFFDGIRKQNEVDSDSRVPIVFRHLDGMMRLLIAETRLRHGTKTEMRDVKRVMVLVQESFKALIDPITGKMDADLLETGMSMGQREIIKMLKKIIEELQDELRCAVPLEDIKAKAMESGIAEKNIENAITKLKVAGEIIEISNERYKVY